MSSILPAANDKRLTTAAKPLVAGHFQRRFLWAGKQGWKVRRDGVWGREARRWFTEELKNPNPVSRADPSILRGLFHPNADKVAPSYCAMVSAVLNLG